MLEQPKRTRPVRAESHLQTGELTGSAASSAFAEQPRPVERRYPIGASPVPQRGTAKATGERRKAREPRDFVTAYKYEDLSRRVVFEHVRWMTPTGKGFSYRYRVGGTGAPWIWKAHPDVKRLLYRSWYVADAVEMGWVIYWAEGEKDAEALVDADEVGTTHASGAGNATAAHAEAFRGHRGRVFVLADNDEGAGAHCASRRYDLLRAVGIPKCRLQILRAAQGKDAHDHLVTHGLTVGEFVPVSYAEVKAQADRWRRNCQRIRTTGADGYWPFWLIHEPTPFDDDPPPTDAEIEAWQQRLLGGQP